jgi:hypothetical protein
MSFQKLPLEHRVHQSMTCEDLIALNAFKAQRDFETFRRTIRPHLKPNFSLGTRITA